VLADLLARQLVLGDAAQRGGQLGHRVEEAAVPGVDLHLGAGPRQVDVPGLLVEHAEQGRVGGRRRAVEVTGGVVPRPRPVGDDREDAVGALVLDPVGDLAAHPLGAGRIGRREEDEPPRPVEGLHDRGPQVRVGRQAGVVTEHPQGAPAVPRLGVALQRRLEGRGELAVGGVAVGDEGVVGLHARRR
jgi:hypothetical protein